MEPWWKGTKYDMPEKAPAWFKNGIPWETFDEQKPPLVYDPPQWKPGYLPHWAQQCNFWSYRSPWFVCPINCHWAPRRCDVGRSNPAHFQSEDEPDEWMKKMITSGLNEKSPERLRGTMRNVLTMQSVWWLCDNNAPSETLFTFGDADWSDDSTVAVKKYWQNFGVAANCFGCAVTWQVRGWTQEVGPNKKWINLFGGGPGWIYLNQDEFECKGAAVDLYGQTMKAATDEDELMRVSHDDEEKPLSAPNYQRLDAKLKHAVDKREPNYSNSEKSDNRIESSIQNKFVKKKVRERKN
eukprot:Skav234814  [mRNA]  locus=scaffold69:758408:765282:- [translate_table: standard]